MLLLVAESGGPEQKIKIPAQDFVAGVSGMALDAEAGYSVAPNTFTAEGFGTVAAFHAVVLDVSGANLGAVEKQLRGSKRAPNSEFIRQAIRGATVKPIITVSPARTTAFLL